ncbi:MAG: sigma-54 dependent transcriptional regulator [Bacteroidales bacterium]|nr:sigma-54 dependent transcriptional regulator [Bacteroidales bacterium]
MDIQSIKLRFGIIGSDPQLDRAIDIARQVAPTEISVLIYGESGTGKEVFPKIIHQLSARKHGAYIAVNCGAIPEGTIDSELFGHEKGSFTGAHESRKGYFETANGGTIFLDEVAELPLSTQVRLLRVLETGEFMKVGSSKVIKTDVRVVAATNEHVPEAIRKGKFREDLYYRLNTVPIIIPPLRNRQNDILLLFRKFASDFAEKYRMPAVQLDEEAQKKLIAYRWPGNVRELKNITEQVSIIENNRLITGITLSKYLSNLNSELPVLYKDKKSEENFSSEREIMYKLLFDMKKDMHELKKLIFDIIVNNENEEVGQNMKSSQALQKIYHDIHSDINFGKGEPEVIPAQEIRISKPDNADEDFDDTAEVYEESLSLQDKEIDMIKKALDKYNGKRKKAAQELGISERTLYRKIKEYNI